MILQALYEYYQRKSADQKNHIAPMGWEWKEIPFLVVIDKEGNFVTLEDTREGEGRKRRAKEFLVPMSEKKTSGIRSNLLWDNVEYVLGANPRNRDDITKRHDAFLERIGSELFQIKDSPPISCVLRFLGKSPLTQIEKQFLCSASWKEALESNAFVTFKMEGSEDSTIFDSLRDKIIIKTESCLRDVCLVSGEKKYIARLHPAIKGVRGTNTTGGSLVSFNLDAFNSYGKTQNFNAPIGEETAFAYTTALNVLLGKDSLNKSLVGDTSLVFWAQNSSEGAYDIEENFAWYVFDPPKDDPDRGVRAVKGLYEAMKSGHIPVFDENRFYVLGLSPNAARIAIRFWRSGTVREFGERILKHFDDISIDKGPKDSEYLTVNQMLRATAFEYKMENVPPNMCGAVMTSILDGTTYPNSLHQQCLRRTRAERKITYARAAILKGCLNRKNYIKGGLQMSLDRNNSNSGYLLGRLFAILEKIQETANPNINTTIRDRFYGAASSSPVAVFSQLLKLKNHHLAKIENRGLKVFYEKEIGEVMNGIYKFPANLSIDDQACFAIGYYHQRQDFFSKKS